MKKVKLREPLSLSRWKYGKFHQKIMEWYFWNLTHISIPNFKIRYISQWNVTFSFIWSEDFISWWMLNGANRADFLIDTAADFSLISIVFRPGLSPWITLYSSYKVYIGIYLEKYFRLILFLHANLGDSFCLKIYLCVGFLFKSE